MFKKFSSTPSSKKQKVVTTTTAVKETVFSSKTEHNYTKTQLKEMPKAEFKVLIRKTDTYKFYVLEKHAVEEFGVQTV